MTEKIRVLHCIETIASGGVEQVRLTLVRGLPIDRFEHKIICTWKGGPIAETLEAEGVELIPIGSFKHPFQWSKHKQVLRVIRKFKPHIIHGAIFEGMSMAAISGTLGRVPVRILEETSEPTTRSKKALWIQGIFSNMTDKIIGISPSVYTFLTQKAGISKDKVVLINNGVSVPGSKIKAISKADLGLAENDIILGGVGRVYNNVKRFSDILESLQILGNPRIKFLLIGDGPDLPSLKLKAKSLGVENQFISLGYQSSPQSYMESMDVFLIPSAHEGFGLVAVEAMYANLPVIASRVGGLKDVVLDGETGFLVSPLSPRELAEKINVLIDRPDLRSSMGQKGRLRALKFYTAKGYCDEIMRLYLDLLEKKGILISETYTC
jgi:glycosyltransferase involved in cell wall biosynthesis